MMSTEAHLMSLLDAWPETEGEGPYLLLLLSVNDGLQLIRFETLEDANAMAVNALGYASWIFEVGREIKPDPSGLEFIPDEPSVRA